MTELIKQRTLSDCVPCSMAMFLGLTYEEIVRPAVELTEDEWSPHSPMYYPLMWAMFEKLGTPVASSKYLLLHRPAIVSVLSPTRPDWLHAVYWDGERIWDPMLKPVIDVDYMMGNFVQCTQSLRDMVELVQSVEHQTRVASAKTLVEER